MKYEKSETFYEFLFGEIEKTDTEICYFDFLFTKNNVVSKKSLFPNLMVRLFCSFVDILDCLVYPITINYEKSKMKITDAKKLKVEIFFLEYPEIYLFEEFVKSIDPSEYCKESFVSFIEWLYLNRFDYSIILFVCNQFMKTTNFTTFESIDFRDSNFKGIRTNKRCDFFDNFLRTMLTKIENSRIIQHKLLQFHELKEIVDENNEKNALTQLNYDILFKISRITMNN